MRTLAEHLLLLLGGNILNEVDLDDLTDHADNATLEHGDTGETRSS